MPLSSPFDLGTQLDSAVIATIAGFIVGAIIKFVNKLFDGKKNQLDEHVTLRKELREELDTVKDELYKLQTELDDWREKYFHQVELTNSLKMDILRLTDELTEYKRISGIHQIEDLTRPNEFLK